VIVLEELELLGMRRLIVLADPSVGLRAFIVIDDLSLGPAAGGVRTFDYSDEQSALHDAAELARAMTIKCALAGIDAGGGKAVMWPPRGAAARAAAFERLGEHIEELGGLFRTAGDLGTGPADLAAMARTTRYVHTEERGLTAAAARGLRACVAAAAELRGRGLAGLHVAVQGVGAVGSAVARELARVGCRLTLADLDAARVRALADELGAQVAAPDALLASECDVLAPCGQGGVLTVAAAAAVRAFAVCGAANNLLASPEAGAALAARGVLVVPDTIASAGAVIEGIGHSVMELDAGARAALVERLGVTAGEVLREAAAAGKPPDDIARARAHARIASRR